MNKSGATKWQHQPERRGASWATTIKAQRKLIACRLEKTPSLKPELNDGDCWAEVWIDALQTATRETGLGYEAFPEVCPWAVAEILDSEFLPGAIITRIYAKIGLTRPVQQ